MRLLGVFFISRVAKAALFPEPLWQHMGKEEKYLLAFTMTAAAGARALFCRAVAAVGAANTFFAAFLGFIHIPCGKAQDRCDYGDNNEISHSIYFLPLRAYSALTCLSELMHRKVTMAAITTTATSPP